MSRADRGRQHRHRRDRRRTLRPTPSGSCATRAATASRSAATATCGPPTSATALTRSAGLANVAGQAQDRRLGRRASSTTPTRRCSTTTTSAQVAKYPTDAAYAAATGSALALIGPRLRAAGKLVIPNFGDWRVYRSDGHAAGCKYVSGGMEEHFTKWGRLTRARGYFTGADWDDQLAAAQGDAGDWASSSSASRTPIARRPRRGPLRLGDDAAGGRRQRVASRCTTTTRDETWFPEYDYDLGAPDGRRVQGRRAASTGAPSSAGSCSSTRPTRAWPVRFGGRYRGSGLGAPRGTVMRPHTGLVLLVESAAAPPRRVARRAAPRRNAASRRRSLRVRVACRRRARASAAAAAITVAVPRAGAARRRRPPQGDASAAPPACAVRLSAKGHAALKRGPAACASASAPGAELAVQRARRRRASPRPSSAPRRARARARRAPRAGRDRRAASTIPLARSRRAGAHDASPAGRASPRPAC